MPRCGVSHVFVFIKGVFIMKKLLLLSGVLLLSGAAQAKTPKMPTRECAVIKNMYGDFEHDVRKALNVKSDAWSEAGVKRDIEIAVVNAVEKKLLDLYGKMAKSSPKDQDELGKKIFGFLPDIALMTNSLQDLYKSIAPRERKKLVTKIMGIRKQLASVIESAIKTADKTLTDDLKVKLSEDFINFIKDTKDFPQLEPIANFYKAVNSTVKKARYNFVDVTPKQLKVIFTDSLKPYGCTFKK
jgi:hypothetical protein